MIRNRGRRTSCVFCPNERALLFRKLFFLPTWILFCEKCGSESSVSEKIYRKLVKIRSRAH
jgi:hypothetical protein